MKIVHIAGEEQEEKPIVSRLSKKQLIHQLAVETVAYQTALDRLAALDMFTEEAQILKALKQELQTLKK